MGSHIMGGPGAGIRLRIGTDRVERVREQPALLTDGSFVDHLAISAGEAARREVAVTAASIPCAVFSL